MTDADFRTRQALADLERAAADDPLADDTSAAFDPAAPPARFWEATACLLWQALAGRTEDHFLEDIWDHRHADLIAAPAPIRAASMQGYRLLRHHRPLDGIDAPAPADLVTLPQMSVAAALIRIGRQISSDEMDHVARADYGCDVARHRAALEALLLDPQLAYPEGDLWYPAEVVELVSHVPGQPGHEPCLAIVLLDALRTGDERGEADYRLASQFEAIAGFVPEVRDPFFAAFRHLYESSPSWTSWLPEPFTLPWIELIAPPPAKSDRRKR